MSAVPIATKVSEFIRWAMFLCGQNFETADTHLSMVGRAIQPESSKLLERYVLKLPYSPTETYFIVFDAGTKYTTRDLPSWATSECVFEKDVSKPELRTTLARLKILTQEILQTIDLPDSFRADLSGTFEGIKGADCEPDRFGLQAATTSRRRSRHPRSRRIDLLCRLQRHPR